jgi:hypothetical protein
VGILGSIFHKIFPGKDAAPAAAPATTLHERSTGSQRTGSSTGRTGASSSITAPVDVEQVLNGMLASSGQQLNWRSSIVDLLELLGLDSSLQ